jgi:heat-inducible transcriptional repressor
MLTKRQEQLLGIIVEEYVRSAEPVGSKFLSENFELGVSPATIRSEMVILEKLGLIQAMHTSAGRLPTENGYRYYIKNILPNANIKENSVRSAVQENDEAEQVLKSLAKRLVELSGETAIVTFDSERSYYTGVSELFHKPDFNDMERVRSLSDLVDRFDDVMHSMSSLINDYPEVFIGTNNPFGDQMATVVVRYKLPNNKEGMLGLVGPIRMDYAKNLALIERAKQVIIDLYE